MRRLLVIGAFAALFVAFFAVSVSAEPLKAEHQGTVADCVGGVEWHFVHNQTDATSGTITVGDQQVANTGYVAGDGARRDAGTRLVHEIVTVFANYDIHTEVLAASIRNAVQLSEMLLAGADILTVPAALLHGVADHPLSDAGLRSFVDDAQVFSAG